MSERVKLLLKSPINSNTGYGNDSIGMILAMLRAGIDVRLEPNHVAPPLAPEITDLFQKKLDAPFDLVVHHIDPMQLGVSKTYTMASQINVGWSMWEWPTLEPMRKRGSFKSRVQNFDIVLGYDDVTLEAFSSRMPKKVSLAKLQGGHDFSGWDYRERDWEGTFRFTMVGQLSDRKNPYCAIQAFKELKDEHPEEMENVEFHLKETLPFIPPQIEQWCPGLFIYSGNWSREKLKEFYYGCHVMVMPSRGEGKNIPCLEMLSTGGSCIATNYGGMAEWLRSEYAYPLNYEYRAPVNNSLEGAGANADINHLKELMLHCVRNRDEVKRKGELGSRVIPEAMSWDNKIVQLFQTLNRELPEKMQDVYPRFLEGMYNELR